uniref:Uncharacterized protein n=1 Tax=Arundo donax TaxID=35708 RepID=A0A0A9SS28_ARUDO
MRSSRALRHRHLHPLAPHLHYAVPSLIHKRRPPRTFSVISSTSFPAPLPAPCPRRLTY